MLKPLSRLIKPLAQAALLICALNITAQAEKVLYLNNQFEPPSLYPALGMTENSWTPVNSLFEGLTRLDKGYNAGPGVAQSWDISSDGKTYTFHLRHDAKWSNGENVTAHDFVYAWTKMLSPALASPAAFFAMPIKGAQDFNSGKSKQLDSIKALDDFTLQVELEHPEGAFLNIITNPSFFPVNQKLDQSNPNWYKDAKTYVSNGPFELSQWQHQQSMRMNKNPYYWDAKEVKLDALDWAMVGDTNIGYLLYKTNELDVTPSPLPALLYDRLKNTPDFKNSPQAGIYFFRFNTLMPPFQNQKIRAAFAMAINQKTITQFVTKQGRPPAYGFVSPGFIGPDGKDFRQDNGDLLHYDLQAAKKLLAQGMQEEHYTSLPDIQYSYINNADERRIAEALQAQLKDNLNVSINLQSIESKVFFGMQRKLKFQFSRSTFLNDYADPYNSLVSFRSNNSMNRTGWSNTHYDQLIDQAAIETNPQKRWQALLDAEKILFTDLPIAPLLYFNKVYLQKPYIKDVLMPPVGYPDFKYTDKLQN